MSIRIKIMNEIDRRPQSLRHLKDVIGNDKKVTKEVAALMAQGRIVKKDGLLYSVAQVGKQPGRLQSVHSRSGRNSLVKEGLPCTIVKLGATFGFAQRKDGEGDIFLPGRSMLGAMPGDEVLVKLFDRPRVPGTQEGEVVAITRPQNEFVGTVRRDYYDQLVVLPDACPSLEIPLKKSALAGAREGDKIVATLLRRGAGHADHRAGVGFVFGSAEEAKQCARALLYAHGIASKFPPEALKEADALKNAQVKLKDTKGRMDLRTLPIFTIDSASTKDIDDAISIFESEYGFELGVHIADVSHYVPAGSALDKEAFARGTSVYYADSVIPMLPRELSNGICSLNPGENRLAFSCLIWLDKQGNIKSYRFEKTVIRSRVKGVYSEINALYEGGGEAALSEKYAEVAGQLPALRRLYEERLRQRRERGGMDIESGESKLILDEKGVCVDVQPRERGLSEAIIEECMLLANQCAAHLARTKLMPFVYRVHEEPGAEHLTRLYDVLKACGVEPVFAGEVPTPKELAAILDEFRGQPLEKAIHSGILRGMEKAKYSPEPKGHYGLALGDYAHFTSPIRRYPDLAIHRILSAFAAGEKPEAIQKKFAAFAAEASLQASGREVKAQQAERGAEDCYKAEYMRAHLGEVFEGVVSGVTAHGLYVQLPNTVEGLVHATTLCKAQPVLVEGVRFADPLGGGSWSMGDTLKVQAVKADVALGKIDFIPAP